MTCCCARDFHFIPELYILPGESRTACLVTLVTHEILSRLEARSHLKLVYEISVCILSAKQK